LIPTFSLSFLGMTICPLAEAITVGISKTSINFVQRLNK
jgi:hypothetical protein